jgi:hypothetical protein
MKKLLYKLIELMFYIPDMVFEGECRHIYWRIKNILIGKPNYDCLCTMREECRSCWTKWRSK